MDVLPKMLHQFEKDLNLGDFVILFPNPDALGANNAAKENFISPDEAVEHFEDLTQTSTDFGNKAQFLKALRRAFTEAFFELKNNPKTRLPKSKRPKPKKDERVMRKNISQKLKVTAVQLAERAKNPRVPIINLDPMGSGPNVLASLMENINKLTNAPEALIAARDANRHTSYAGTETPRLSQSPYRPSTIGNNNIGDQRISENSLHLVSSTPLEVSRLGDGNLGPGQGRFSANTSFLGQPNTERAPLVGVDGQLPDLTAPRVSDPGVFGKGPEEDLKQAEEFMEETIIDAEDEANAEKEVEIRKIIVVGGFLEKFGDKWVRTNNTVKDYMTLLRQLVYVILGFSGFVVREFVIQGGEVIVAVCYAHNLNLCRSAELKGMTKALAIGVVDLMSLEPVDRRFRPLRVNHALHDPDIWTRQYDSQGLELRRELLATLNRINFKEIVRRCKGNWEKHDNVKEYPTEVFEHEVVPLTTWVDYLSYLRILENYFNDIELTRKRVLEQNKNIADFHDKGIIRRIMTANKPTLRVNKNTIARQGAEAYKTAMLNSYDDLAYVPIPDEHLSFLSKKQYATLLRLRKAAETKNQPPPLREHSLENIYSAHKMRPPELFTEFFNPSNNRKPRLRELFEIIWKDYTSNEVGKRSTFALADKAEICEWHLVNSLNISQLSFIQKNLLKKLPKKFPKIIINVLRDAFVPIHDFGLLLGNLNQPRFKSLLQFKKSTGDRFIDFRTVQNQQKINVEGHYAVMSSSVIPDIKANLRSDRRSINYILGNEPVYNSEIQLAMATSYKVPVSSANINPERNNVIARQSPRNRSKYTLTEEEINKILENEIEMKKITIAEACRMSKKFNEDQLEKFKILKTIAREERFRKVLHEYFLFMEKLDVDGVAGMRDSFRELPYSDPDELMVKSRPNIERYYLGRKERQQKNRFIPEKNLWPVSTFFKLNFFSPWNANWTSVTAYFGKKISVYFFFLKNFLTIMIPIVLFGILVYVFDFITYYFNTVRGVVIADTVLIYFFCFFTICWIHVFFYKWKITEEEFLLQTGSKKVLNEPERNSFNNFEYSRDLVNDNLNIKNHLYLQMYLKVFILILFTLVFYAASFGLTVGIFFLKDRIYEGMKDVREKWVYLNHNFANVIEMIKMYLFDRAYYWITVRIIRWIDPKYRSEFHSILIFSVMFFRYLNHFFALFVILFFKPAM